ncbi:MAG: alpha-glucosidase/alpha-galactosidase [Clostridia bacterium]|nr:alpha-glucosidase/alpha-galactosidase [Clostridia bacterium]
MKFNYENDRVSDLRIAYIGGGSRGLAWKLMIDCTKAKDLSGVMTLYDIDFEAAKHNEQIGNNIPDSQWKYEAKETIGEALTGADFVVISILPGTFDEMESDVHAPEKYGIYQSVGDTTSVGGVLRAMRTVPMMEEIAHAIEKYAPNAWVINYTNPMAMCIDALYRAFPGIKAFGCCHEVFGTQRVLSAAIEDQLGVKNVDIHEIHTDVVGINHFTWFTGARYRNVDLFPVYKAVADKYFETGFNPRKPDAWKKDTFASDNRVKFDLFRKYGYIAAAGDRHLAEFMDPDLYLKDPETVKSWHFSLTSVAWRKKDLENRLEKSRKLRSGEERFTLSETGEEGIAMIRALLGITPMITNVNLPNRGQISNLPLGTVVETNATFRADTVTPVWQGEIPESIYPLIRRIADEMNETVSAAMSRSYEKCFAAFCNNHGTKNLTDAQKKALFDEMVKNTEKYLKEYH